MHHTKTENARTAKIFNVWMCWECHIFFISKTMFQPSVYTPDNKNIFQIIAVVKIR